MNKVCPWCVRVGAHSHAHACTYSIYVMVRPGDNSVEIRIHESSILYEHDHALNRTSKKIREIMVYLDTQSTIAGGPQKVQHDLVRGTAKSYNTTSRGIESDPARDASDETADGSCSS